MLIWFYKLLNFDAIFVGLLHSISLLKFYYVLFAEILLWKYLIKVFVMIFRTEYNRYTYIHRVQLFGHDMNQNGTCGQWMIDTANDDDAQNIKLFYFVFAFLLLKFIIIVICQMYCICSRRLNMMFETWTHKTFVHQRREEIAYNKMYTVHLCTYTCILLYKGHSIKNWHFNLFFPEFSTSTALTIEFILCI